MTKNTFTYDEHNFRYAIKTELAIKVTTKVMKYVKYQTQECSCYTIPLPNIPWSM